MQKIKIGILLLVIFNNCTNEINYKLKGIRGVSSSLNESKQRATFLNRYYLVNSRDDSFSIKYAFIERAFWYGNTFNETHIDLKLNDKERFQFIILFTNIQIILIEYSNVHLKILILKIQLSFIC